MTDTSISDAIVWPQDEGTGLPSPNRQYADMDSAAYIGLMAEHVQGSHVGDGMVFDVDAANDTTHIEAGYAFVTDDADVQSGSQQDYDTSLPSQFPYLVVFPSATSSLSFDVDAVNDVYLAVDPSANDSVYVRHGSSVTQPTDPSMKLGTVDTTDGSVERTARTLTVENDGLASQGMASKTRIPDDEHHYIPEDYSQVVVGPYEVDGSLTVDGRLEII